MRRILAITVIGALICATGLPLWASACANMKTAPMCHRMAPEHHCDMESQDDSGDQETGLTMSSHTSDCPMRCCMQSSAGTSIAVASRSDAVLLPVITDPVYSTTPTFVTNGFSSHTDRGPPIATI